MVQSYQDKKGDMDMRITELQLLMENTKEEGREGKTRRGVNTSNQMDLNPDPSPTAHWLCDFRQ